MKSVVPEVSLRGLLVLLLVFAPILFVETPVHARPGFGPEAEGMGGAGVASVEDHMAPTWNPANLSARDGLQFGINAGAGYESTGNFAEDIETTEEVFNDYQGDSWGNKGFYSSILENSDAINRLVEGEDAGLVDLRGGANVSWGNFGVGVNNYSEGTIFWDGSGQSLFRAAVGSNADSSDIGKLLENISDTDFDSVDFGSEPGSQEYRDAAESIKKDIDQALEGDSVCDVVDCEGKDISSDSVANAIAKKGEELKDAGYEEATADNLETFSNNFMDDVIGLARDVSGASSLSPGGLSGNQLVPAASTGSDSAKLVAEGLMVNEAIFSYSSEVLLDPHEFGDLYLGASLKFMQGTVGSAFCLLEEDSCDINADDNTRKSSTFGVDAGLRYHVKDYNMKFGIVGKNLNAPSFPYPDDEKVLARHRGEEIELEPSFRAGVELRPLYFMPTSALGRDWWQLSADYDVTSVDSVFENYERQELALGNEFNILNWPWLNLALRAGLRENLAESRSPTVYTLGTGLRLPPGLNLDAAVSLSDRTVTRDGEEIPTILGGDLAVSFEF